MFFLHFQVPIAYGSSATVVQKALNDLPTLETEGVTVKSDVSINGGIIYTITFTPNRGLIYKIINLNSDF